jgi:hypothetical protein
MFRRGEEVEVRESKERGGDGGEEEIRIQNLYLLQLLSRCEGMNRLFNDRWLFTVRSQSRRGLLEAS